MVGGQALAPSQCSVGFVNTIGCADGDLPENGVPKPPSQAGRWLPSSTARDEAGEMCRALTRFWKGSCVPVALPFLPSPPQGITRFLQLHPQFSAARRQRSRICSPHGACHGARSSGRHSHPAAPVPGQSSPSPGWCANAEGISQLRSPLRHSRFRGKPARAETLCVRFGDSRQWVNGTPAHAKFI